MTKGAFKIEDKKLLNAFKDMMKVVDNPQKPVEAMAKRYIVGIDKQFETKGSHWGTPWPETEEVFQNIRDWQGYNETPTMQASGDLRSKWISDPINGYKGGIRVGSAVDYAEKMHNGKSGMATFSGKAGGKNAGKSFTMPVNPQKRPIIPEKNGLNKDEIDDMEKELRDPIEKAWNKNA